MEILTIILLDFGSGKKTIIFLDFFCTVELLFEVLGILDSYYFIFL